MRLWFGKYKGSQLENLPDDYLDWLSTVDLRNQRLHLAVEEERQRRLFFQENRGRVNAKLIDELVSAGVRSLARKYHPDHGGSNERMQLVNICAAWIKAQARELLAIEHQPNA
jgi:hypothetical protein